MTATILQLPIKKADTPAFLFIDRGSTDDKRSLMELCANRVPCSCEDKSACDHVLSYYDVTKNGKANESFSNLTQFIRWAGIDVKYDTFAHDYYVTGVPHRHKLDDEALGDIRMTLSSTFLKCSKEFLADFLEARGRENPYNPLLDHLRSLKWDGVARLETALVRHLGAEDTAYTRAVTRAWHIGACKRLLNPGCKFDNVLTCIGAEGLYKSGYFSTMSYDIYFCDSLPLGASPKETFEVACGKWIVEHADLAGIARKEVEQVKAYITRRVDEGRGAYARKSKSVPRQFALAATGNKDTPLQGATGNRRWWIVPCTKLADLAAVERERDQLWGEAMHYALAGEPHWLTGSLEVEARKVQRDHTSVGILQRRIEEALADCVGFVPTSELLACIGIEEGDVSKVNHGHKDTIESAVQRLGWKHGRKWVVPQANGGAQASGYESPEGWGGNVLHWTGAGLGFVQETGDEWLTRQRQRATDSR